MQSMTGFGRAEGVVGSSLFTVEIKSVNHRYLDARFRLPPFLSLHEIQLSELLRSRFERGSFEIVVKQRPVAGEAGTVTTGTRFLIDEAAAESLAQCCYRLTLRMKTPSYPTLEVMALTNKIFIPVEDTPDPGVILQSLMPLLDQALGAAKKMRESEGARLKQLLADGIAELTRITEGLAAEAPAHPKRVETKLKNRIAQWGLPGNVEPQRLEWEVAFYADRADITEEIDRLRAHAKEFLATLESPKAVGRKLDFLTQELHREMNTVASKADAIEVTRLAVDGKTCIERLREQVQNVE